MKVKTKSDPKASTGSVLFAVRISKRQKAKLLKLVKTRVVELNGQKKDAQHKIRGNAVIIEAIVKGLPLVRIDGKDPLE